jgi:hypothetical protein
MRPADVTLTDVRVRSVKVERSADICAHGSAEAFPEPLAGVPLGDAEPAGVEVLLEPMAEALHAATRATPPRLMTTVIQRRAAGIAARDAVFTTPCFPAAGG